MGSLFLILSYCFHIAKEIALSWWNGYLKFQGQVQDECLQIAAKEPMKKEVSTIWETGTIEKLIETLMKGGGHERIIEERRKERKCKTRLRYSCWLANLIVKKEILGMMLFGARDTSPGVYSIFKFRMPPNFHFEAKEYEKDCGDLFFECNGNG